MATRNLQLDEEFLAFCEKRTLHQEKYLLRLERQLMELQRKIIMARSELIGFQQVSISRRAELMEDNDE